MDEFSSLIDGVAGRGWAISTTFLPENEVEALAEEVRDRLGTGDFRKAGIGSGTEFRVRRDIRGDLICWIDEQSPTPAMIPYLNAVERLRIAVNRELFVGVESVEVHLAAYPPGTFYRRHLDRFSDRDERILSCTFYLNRDWKPEDGGALRLYERADDTETFTDVWPQFGTFALFRSDLLYHEVLPTGRERLSVTGWFRRRSAGTPATGIG